MPLPEEVLLTVLEQPPVGGGTAGVHPAVYGASQGEKFEWVVQKSVELGVGEIVPVLSRRCVSRPDPKSFAKKLQRYQPHRSRGRQAERQGADPGGAGTALL